MPDLGHRNIGDSRQLHVDDHNTLHDIADLYDLAKGVILVGDGTGGVRQLLPGVAGMVPIADPTTLTGWRMGTVGGGGGGGELPEVVEGPHTFTGAVHFAGDVITQTSRTQIDATSSAFATPQAALNALPDGGLLWLPPGVTDGSLVLPSNKSVHIKGAGQTASTLRRVTAGGAVISGVSVRESTIEDLKLDATNTATWGIDITSMFRTRLSHLWVTGGLAGGIRLLTTLAAGGLYYNNFVQVFVHLNALRGWHIEPHADGYANSNHFDTCTGSRTTGGTDSTNWCVKGLFNSTWTACTAEGASTTEKGFVARKVLGAWISGLIELNTIYQIDTDPDGVSDTQMLWIMPTVNHTPAGGGQLGQRHSKNAFGGMLGDLGAFNTYGGGGLVINRLAGQLIVERNAGNDESIGVKTPTHQRPVLALRNDGRVVWRDHTTAAIDVELYRAAPDVLATPDTLELGERPSDPAAPGADKARLFARDNGSGKTQLCVRFPTGAVQVLSTEP